MTVRCDVSDEHDVEKMVAETVARFGGIDILVNNAAYFMTVKHAPFWELDVDAHEGRPERTRVYVAWRRRWRFCWPFPATEGWDADHPHPQESAPR